MSRLGSAEILSRGNRRFIAHGIPRDILDYGESENPIRERQERDSNSNSGIFGERALRLSVAEGFVFKLCYLRYLRQRLARFLRGPLCV